VIVADTFAPMRRSTRRIHNAWLLLAVMLFMAVPRSAFHHCEEGAFVSDPHGASTVVHVDLHCPICEAPAPLHEGLRKPPVRTAALCNAMRHVLGTPLRGSLLVAEHRLRGPPVS
jgi:hypothetical protein